jgi:hypothetical protein
MRGADHFVGVAFSSDQAQEFVLGDAGGFVIVIVCPELTLTADLDMDIVTGYRLGILVVGYAYPIKASIITSLCQFPYRLGTLDVSS